MVTWLCLLPAAGLGQVVWDRGARNYQWGSAKNWNPNGVPTAGSNVQFNATPNITSDITLDANRVANSLTFNNVNDNFSITDGSGANTLRLTSRTITRTSGSSGNQALTFTTLAPQNDWDGGWTWDIGGTGSLTIASNITGGWGTNVKSGNGTLVLSGNNIFSGSTNINAGVLVAASDNALGTSTWGNSVANGAALHLQGGISLSEGQFTVTGTGSGGTGALRNLGGNNTLNAAVDLGGNTTISSDSGTLTVAGQFNLGSGNTLAVNGAGNTAFSGAVTNSGAITKNGTGTLTFSGTGANSSSGALAINNGTVVLQKSAGTHAYSGSGGITIGDGLGAASSAVLRLGASNQIADYAGTLTVNADGVFQLNNFSEGINTLAGTGLIDLATSGYLAVGVNSGSSTFGGSLSGTGTFVKSGSGSLTLTSDLNFNGTFVLAGGTLRLSDIALTVGTLELAGNSTIDFAGAKSSLFATNLDLHGFTLTITNWADATDYFYAANWNGAVTNVRGLAPMNQVSFNGFTAADTQWQSYDSQVTPVPEPATYGAALLLVVTSLIFVRRRQLCGR